ncbi:MAG: hypothetical protein ACN2B6_06470 [Rickettsiales bacterium]
MFRLLILSIATLAAQPAWHANAHPNRYIPDVSINTPPLQKPPHGGGWQHGEFNVTPLADFHIQARVLSTKHYDSGKSSALSPVDFVLGWQQMADKNFLRKVTIKHLHRSYRYHYRYRHRGYNQQHNKDIMHKTVSTQSANMHMVPATPEIEKKLLSVQTDDIVTLHGHLVRINHSNGWKWTSSLTRTDTGKDSCEVVWVDKITIEQP